MSSESGVMNIKIIVKILLKIDVEIVTAFLKIRIASFLA